MATMSRINIRMMMGVPGNGLVGMMHFHGGTGSRHVNERDCHYQKTVEEASHLMTPFRGQVNLSGAEGTREYRHPVPLAQGENDM